MRLLTGIFLIVFGATNFDQTEGQGVFGGYLPPPLDCPKCPEPPPPCPRPTRPPPCECPPQRSCPPTPSCPPQRTCPAIPSCPPVRQCPPAPRCPLPKTCPPERTCPRCPSPAEICTGEGGNPFVTIRPTTPRRTTTRRTTTRRTTTRRPITTRRTTTRRPITTRRTTTRRPVTTPRTTTEHHHHHHHDHHHHSSDPLDWLRESIPGEPGRDYPIHKWNDFPVTKFTCDDKIVGIYADVESGCQVYRFCYGEGFNAPEMISQICPNGTLFDQKIFTCNWYYHVVCEEAPDYYDLNKNIGAHPAMMMLESFRKKRKKSFA